MKKAEWQMACGRMLDCRDRLGFRKWQPYPAFYRERRVARYRKYRDKELTFHSSPSRFYTATRV